MAFYGGLVFEERSITCCSVHETGNPHQHVKDATDGVSGQGFGEFRGSFGHP